MCKFSQCLISLTHGRCLVNIQGANEQRVSWQIPSRLVFGSRLAALSWLPVCQIPRFLGGFRVWPRVGQCTATQCGGFCLRYLESHMCLLKQPFSPNECRVCALCRGQGYVSPVPKNKSWPLPQHPFLLSKYQLSVFLCSTQHTHINIFFLSCACTPRHFLTCGFSVDSLLNHLISSSR